MIGKLLALCLFFSIQSFAIERNVVVRNQKGKLVLENVELPDLISRTHFEGKYFKIVHKVSSDPVQMDDSDIAQKAANAYYHLSKARTFFANLGRVQTEPMIIRIDIENRFHKRFHFQNPKVNPVFNNATTINRGTGVSELGIAAWGHEIWFRPAKKIKVSQEYRKRFRQLARELMPKQSKPSLDDLLFTLISASVSDDIVGSLKDSGQFFLQNYLTSSFLRMAVPELMFLLSKKYFYFDAVFIPEVIYHEYTHFAMSDFVPPIANTAVLEGFCDFFAAQISGRDKLIDTLGSYGTLVQQRSVLSKGYYFSGIDTEAGLGNDFVLSLFYELKVMLTSKENDLYAMRTLFDIRKGLSVETKVGENFSDLFWQYLPDYKMDAMMILNLRGI